ncbi:MAG: right-handed parallel beta-helix repeat-containing protein [Gemmatimonadales bacterium]
MAALTACGSEPPVAPHAHTLAASAVAQPPLKVDDDAADCPDAGYSTIQAAVDAAGAGTTILVCAGTYAERVAISGAAKNGLQLLALGEPGTVLLDGDNPSPTVPFNHAFHLVDVSGVLIEGFTVREYFENIKMTGGGGNTIRRNRTTAAGHDGIFAANSPRNLIEHNVSFDNPSGNACGVNVAGAGSVGNVVRYNRLINNNWGIRIQGGATNTVAFGNVSLRNRSHGIQNVGAATTGATIDNNDALGNPTGIEVTSSSGVTVVRNRAFHSATFDLVDGGVDNVFVNNHCETSSPPGLCAHTEGASK